ncbi:MAG: hypothetical protein AAGA03_07020 [Planctomycetota bacterium]
MIYTQWTGQAMVDYWNNFSVLGAWSNIALGFVIAITAMMSLRADRVQLNKTVSAMSLFFLSIFCVNAVATMSHMIEHYPPIAMTLRLDLDFLNHSAIGFCALWVEVSILERVRELQKRGLLTSFPKPMFVGFVITTFALFQAVNWSIRLEPNFNYAILDYMLSLTVLLLFCLYVVVKLPESIDKRYEAFSIASFIILAVASVAHIALTDLLPVGEASINANDVYHMLTAPAFFTLYKAKCLATSSQRQPNLQTMVSQSEAKLSARYSTPHLPL